MDFSLIQHWSFLFAVLSVIIIIYWGFQYKSKWLYSVPALVWLFHVLAYFICYLADKNNIVDFEELFNMIIFYSRWSSYVRFHAIFTLFVSAFILAHFDEKIVEAVKNIWKLLKNI